MKCLWCGKHGPPLDVDYWWCDNKCAAQWKYHVKHPGYKPPFPKQENDPLEEIKELHAQLLAIPFAQDGPSWERDAAQLNELLPSLRDYGVDECPAPQVFVSCPSGRGRRPDPVWAVIQHLNDAHKWTREQIADWLDSLPDFDQELRVSDE